ncbi:MAG: hypothetical protein HZC28_18195 [Spirochaetes bacterium]|nr:hypothetical protein [Spirochaetota bacterium]
MKHYNRLTHWDLYLTLEDDLKKVARYVEFDRRNGAVFSIELSRILQIASSENDVVLRLLCGRLNAVDTSGTMDEYRAEIMRSWPSMADEKVFAPGHDLTLMPWKRWKQNENPNWWRAYNKIKHERERYFTRANLRNALQSVAALLVSISYFYLIDATMTMDVHLFRDVLRELKNESGVFRLNAAYY